MMGAGVGGEGGDSSIILMGFRPLVPQKDVGPLVRQGRPHGTRIAIRIDNAVVRGSDLANIRGPRNVRNPKDPAD